MKRINGFIIGIDISTIEGRRLVIEKIMQILNKSINNN